MEKAQAPFYCPIINKLSEPSIDDILGKKIAENKQITSIFLEKPENYSDQADFPMNVGAGSIN